MASAEACWRAGKKKDVATHPCHKIGHLTIKEGATWSFCGGGWGRTLSWLNRQREQGNQRFWDVSDEGEHYWGQREERSATIGTQSCGAGWGIPWQLNEAFLWPAWYMWICHYSKEPGAGEVVQRYSRNRGITILRSSNSDSGNISFTSEEAECLAPNCDLVLLPLRESAGGY